MRAEPSFQEQPFRCRASQEEALQDQRFQYRAFQEGSLQARSLPGPAPLGHRWR